MADLDRTSVDILLLVGERESSHGKAYNSSDDQKQSNNGGWFHDLFFPFVPVAPLLYVSARTVGGWMLNLADRASTAEPMGG